MDCGIRNFEPYSLMLVKQAQEAVKRHEYDAAKVLSNYACLLSPDIPPVYSAQAAAQWHANKLDVPAVAQSLFAAYVKTLSPMNIEDFSMVVFENAAVLAGSILLAFCTIALVLLLAYFSLLYHDVRHSIPAALPDFSVWAMVITLFVLPLVCRLSIIWFCAWSLVLLYAYATRYERFVIRGSFALLILAVPLLAAAMGFAKCVSQDEIINLLWKANYGYCDLRDTQRLEKYLDRFPLDEDVLLSLGLLFKKEGGFSSSQKYYERILDKNPRNYKAAINLGNVHFAQNNWQAAIACYNQAVEMAPSKTAAAHFNLSRIYQSKFMFNESEEALNKAKNIDLSRVSSYLKDISDNFNRLIIDETVDISQIWVRGFNLFMATPAYTRDVWRSAVGGRYFPYDLFVLLALALFAVNIPDKDQVRIAVRCKLCGMVLCRRCQRSASDDLVCAHCQTLLQKQSSLGYGVREDKKNRIKSYITRKRITAVALGYVFPGAGHFYAGQTFIGTAGMLVFFMLVLKTIMPLVFEGPWSFLLGPRSIACAAYGAMLLLYWCLMAVHMRKIQDKSSEENLLLRIVS
ncbi:MAG: tetratricopeptide repeat protein [Deltaproteobacteria bacterium]|nr:tetratricopeptide repeat protein [Deltaproteobacteria bacterium]